VSTKPTKNPDLVGTMTAGGSHRGAAQQAGVPALRAAERIIGWPVTLEECSRVLKAEEAAHFLGLDISSVRHMTSRGELTHIKVNIGGSDEARSSGSIRPYRRH
jgi:hypothetical protein